MGKFKKVRRQPISFEKWTMSAQKKGKKSTVLEKGPQAGKGRSH